MLFKAWASKSHLRKGINSISLFVNETLAFMQDNCFSRYENYGKKIIFDFSTTPIFDFQKREGAKETSL